MKRRRRRKSCGFFDEFCVLSRKKIAREGNLMEEMAPAVTLPLGMVNSVCESPMEIARLKLMADTAVGILMPDPNTVLLCEGEDRDDVEARRMAGSDEDEDESSSVASMVLDAETGTPSSADSTTDAGNSSIELVGASALDLSSPEVRGRKRSVYLLDYFPLWGCVSICGRRLEMEDAVVAVPRFFEIPLSMVAADQVIDGLDASSVHLPAHFFGVYDGHGGAQVANYCQERVHRALIEELQSLKKECASGDGRKKQWEKAFTDCFQKVDDEVGGIVRTGGMEEEEEDSNNGCCVHPAEPIAPETVGTTAVVAVICSSHIIIANCGDSRAVLCRGKLPVALSVDHKPNREDEYARIEAAGGKVIKWNGYRVLGVLAMSRSIGDRYLKPWIIPEPEVTIVPRTKDDECLILASDGLWDVMSNEEACDAARRRIVLWHKKNGVVSTSTQKGEEADPAAQAAADYLSKLALQKGSKDNISVVVIDLKVQPGGSRSTRGRSRRQYSVVEDGGRLDDFLRLEGSEVERISRRS